MREAATPLIEDGRIKVSTWKQAASMLVEQTRAVLSFPVILRSIEKRDPSTQVYVAEIRTYRDSNVSVETVRIPSEEIEDYQANFTQLLLEPGLAVHTYPMLLVKDGALYSYQRTGSSGYEYFSIVHDRVHIERTKKKFNYALFRTNSPQELFWTDVIPVIHDRSGVKANIPQEGIGKFVGRAKQLEAIREDILQVPNENGIIYGPGGIGKTALALQFSKDLYENSDPDNRLFDNIIWVSAKTDYYDYISGTIEPKKQNFKSFDDVLTAILEFFELGGLDEYSFAEKRDLALEQFKECRTLLILDNFETIQTVNPEEANDIVRFFGTDVKKHLSKQPYNFKTILTSRSYIPAGFHPVPLKGLDEDESQELISILEDRHLARLRTNQPDQRFGSKQIAQIYEATQGIPIVIIHCFGQLYEFQKPLDKILRELNTYGANIVQFSYQEVLDQLQKKDSTGLQLKIILLLDLVRSSLLLGQISKILETPQTEIEEKIELLARFQCIERVYQGGQERYRLNGDVRMLARALSLKYAESSSELRRRVSANSVDDFPASDEELAAASLFEEYLDQNRKADADEYFQERLTKFPQSVLLNFHYARHLVGERKFDEAIEVLEKIRQPNQNDRRVLKLLVQSYMYSSIPKFEKAATYVSQLETWARDDNVLREQLADFYLQWAMQLKALPPDGDPIRNRARINNYKAHGEKALELLLQIPNAQRRDRHFHMIAQGYYCTWNYEAALRAAVQAIAIADNPGNRREFEYFQRKIQEQETKFARS